VLTRPSVLPDVAITVLVVAAVALAAVSRRARAEDTSPPVYGTYLNATRQTLQSPARLYFSGTANDTTRTAAGAKGSTRNWFLLTTSTASIQCRLYGPAVPNTGAGFTAIILQPGKPVPLMGMPFDSFQLMAGATGAGNATYIYAWE